jgi:hypothetical protein
MTEIRKALRAKFGARRYRITRSGELHVYGVMPNSNSVGWWFYCYVEDLPMWFGPED